MSTGSRSGLFNLGGKSHLKSRTEQLMGGVQYTRMTSCIVSAEIPEKKYGILIVPAFKNINKT